jgi:Tol biopolymer transport system component
MTLAGHATQFTKTPDGTLRYHPTPSADGQQLLFGTKRRGARQLVVMSLADRSEQQVTALQSGHGAMWPHWHL